RGGRDARTRRGPEAEEEGREEGGRQEEDREAGRQGDQGQREEGEDPRQGESSEGERHRRAQGDEEAQEEEVVARGEPMKALIEYCARQLGDQRGGAHADARESGDTT